ncbi:hypothetical protein BDF19DRAFT_463091 [Syncephalis fuscata]|nr:hypothetical protein BDF19DRAFT_463091 [Syncephalis fuscata]
MAAWITLFTAGLLTLLLCYTQLVASEATFQVSGKNYTYPTQDLFEFRSDFYSITGLAVNATFKKDGDCELTTQMIDTAKSIIDQSANPNGVVNLTIVVDAVQASIFGCHTVVHPGISVYKFKKSTGTIKGVSIENVLYLLANMGGPVDGSVYGADYVTFGFWFPSGQSPIPMALMRAIDYADVRKKNTNNAAMTISIREEQGIWNDSMLSPTYKAQIYILFALNLFFLLRSIFVLTKMIRAGRYMSKYRTLIFAFAFLSSIRKSNKSCRTSLYLMLFTSFMSEILLPIATPSYIWIDNVLEFFTNIAFHLLLLLWHSIVKGVQNVHYLKVVKYIIIGSFTMAMVKFFLFILFGFVSNFISGTNVYIIITIMVVTIQMLYWPYSPTMALFSGSVSENQLLADQRRMHWLNVGGEVFRIVLNRLSYTIRIIVLLFILDLGPSSGTPKDSSNKTGTGANRKHTALSPKSSHSCFSGDSAVMSGHMPTPATASPTRADGGRFYNYNNTSHASGHP